MLAPFELVQFDVEAVEPVRDKEGFCVPVGPGMGVGVPSPGMGRVGTLFPLWNKPYNALRAAPTLSRTLCLSASLPRSPPHFLALLCVWVST